MGKYKLAIIIIVCLLHKLLGVSQSVKESSNLMTGFIYFVSTKIAAVIGRFGKRRRNIWRYNNNMWWCTLTKNYQPSIRHFEFLLLTLHIHIDSI